MLENAPICYLFLYVRDMAATRELLEDRMGFHPIEVDGLAVKYPAGKVMLALNRAADFGIDLGEPHTRGLIVQHVGDVDAATAALAAKGVALGSIDRYDIGGTVEIVNEERHGLMLYEPSDESLTWPSAAKIRAILGGEDPSARTNAHVSEGAFHAGDRPVIYVFLFVRDGAEAADFYGTRLGLKAIEVDDSVGVVKYDAGSFILATHAEDDLGAVGDPPAHARMASVFLVPDVDAAHAGLAARGVVFDQTPAVSAIGKTARFHDPNGHAFFLYEPSGQALDQPSGAILKSMLT